MWKPCACDEAQRKAARRGRRREKASNADAGGELYRLFSSIEVLFLLAWFVTTGQVIIRTMWLKNKKTLAVDGQAFGREVRSLQSASQGGFKRTAAKDKLEKDFSRVSTVCIVYLLAQKT